ncbi:MAG: PLP-dependent cysteine synthase family protein, partial [Fervidobacterium sp.]
MNIIDKLYPIKVGKTPLVFLEKYGIFAKFERYNPMGSVKDRPVYLMIRDAIIKGLINENSTIVEPTSGNTGIALAWLGAKLGIPIILVMPESVSIERRHILKALGADIVLVENMTYAVVKAKEIVEAKKAFMLNQFENPNNVLSHELTTGPEILYEMRFYVDAFVAGVGTGGTITGVGTVLKKFLGKATKIVALEPKSSAVLSGKTPGKHKIQGIGAGFIPTILDKSIIDDIIQIDDDDALTFMQKLWKEGIFVGISSAANLLGAILVKEKFNLDKV